MNNTTEKTPYQILLEKLDDEEFARKFFDEKEAEAKEAIESVSSVLNGWYEITDYSEWGNKTLFQILDLFKIRHKNFEVAQLAENLQIHLFNFSSLAHDKAFDNWSKDWKVENDFEVSQVQQNEQTAPESAETGERERHNDRTKHYVQILANKLSYVLASDDVSDEIKNAISSILVTVANQSNTGVYDEPEIVKTGFPLQIERLPIDYASGIIHSITAIFDNSLPSEVIYKLADFDVRFKPDTPLDLSAMSAESLNTDDTKTDNRRAAECLSEILKNPNMSDEQKNGILGGLEELLEHEAKDDSEVVNLRQSPEYIEAVLNSATQSNE